MAETAKFIFDFNVPWYIPNNTGLKDWEQMFVMRYWEREIGFETFALFKIKLMELLMQKMPYYRTIADAQGLIGDIFVNINETTQNVTDKKTDDTSQTDSLSESTSHNDATQKIDGESNSTATNDGAEKSNNTVTAVNSGTQSSKEDKSSDKSITGTSMDNTAETHSDTTNNTDITTGKDVVTHNTESTNHFITSRDTGETHDDGGRDKTTLVGKNTKTNDLSTVDDTQGLTSNNPQVTLGTRDYASSLQRDNAVKNETGTVTDDIDNTTDYTHNSDGSSSSNTNGTDDTTITNTGDDTTDKTQSVTSTGKATTGIDKQSDAKTTENVEENESRTGEGKSEENRNESADLQKNTSENRNESSTNSENLTKNESSDGKNTGTVNVAHQNRENVNNDGLTYGWRGSKSMELSKFMETIKNINEMLLDDCNILFMGVLYNPWAEDMPLHLY